MKKYFILFGLLIITFLGYSNSIKDLIKSVGGQKENPKDNVLIIFDSTKVDVKESGLSYSDIHVLYKVINNNGAKKLNVLKFGYDPLSANVEIKSVIIYRSNGIEENINIKDIMDYPAPARSIYWGAREKMINIGRLNLGDAIEIKLSRKGFTYALLQDDDDRFIPPMRGHFYDIVDFWNEDRILTKFYQVTVSKNKFLQYKFFNGEINSSLQYIGEKAIYAFTKSNVVPFVTENRMVGVSDVAPKLLLTTSPDWEAKSVWFYKVNEDFGSFKASKEIKDKVNEILKGAKNEMDSVGKLTHWVADEIRYSGISMGKGEGYTLHTGDMTFTDRCGVCKDKAGMLVTMLRAAGFKSYAAMTMAGSRIENIPADYFNHSVTVVKLKSGKYELLDPTWVPFVRELWSSAEQQQNYLMGLPEGADLGETPISAPENHYVKINGNSEIAVDGTIIGEITITAEGQSDAAFRSMFVRNFKNKWKDIIEQEMLRLHPNAQIINYDFGYPYNYNEPIKITISYKIDKYCLLTDNEMLFTPISANIFKNNQSQLLFDLNLTERKYGFRDRCTKLIDINETVKLPMYKDVLHKPDNVSNDGTGASVNGGYIINGNIFKFNLKAKYKKRMYEPEDWNSFKEAVLAQNKYAEEKIILKVK